MRKPKEKPLTEAELRRYERALRLWDIGLQKQEQELDTREAELDSLVDETGESIYEPESDEGNPTPDMMEDVYQHINWEAIGRTRPVMCRPEFQKYRNPALRPDQLFDPEDGCTLTPKEFATTIKCGPGCCNGAHLKDCPVNIYLEVERLAKLEDPRKI